MNEHSQRELNLAQLITENGSIYADNLKDGHRWTDEECLAWNIEYCSSFEEAYEGFQTQMIMPPVLVRGEQMTLFQKIETE